MRSTVIESPYRLFGTVAVWQRLSAAVGACQRACRLANVGVFSKVMATNELDIPGQLTESRYGSMQYGIVQVRNSLK